MKFIVMKGSIIQLDPCVPYMQLHKKTHVTVVSDTCFSHTCTEGADYDPIL